jgi:hypothetical protein
VVLSFEALSRSESCFSRARSVKPVECRGLFAVELVDDLFQTFPVFLVHVLPVLSFG